VAPLPREQGGAGQEGGREVRGEIRQVVEQRDRPVELRACVGEGEQGGEPGEEPGPARGGWRWRGDAQRSGRGRGV
jgi:hypothetical protein